jgi:hypothetical protein
MSRSKLQLHFICQVERRYSIFQEPLCDEPQRMPCKTSGLHSAHSRVFLFLYFFFLVSDRGSRKVIAYLQRSVRSSLVYAEFVACADQAPQNLS